MRNRDIILAQSVRKLESASDSVRFWKSCAATEISGAGKMRRKFLIRPSERGLRALTYLTACSALIGLMSCVLLTAQNVVLRGALGGRVTEDRKSTRLNSSHLGIS